jgi:hypothetical protein
MDCTQIILVKHLLRRLIERALRPLDILAVVQGGEIIENREENGAIIYVLLGSPSGRAPFTSFFRATYRRVTAK